MPLSILGLGTALPPHTMSQEEALQMSTNIICRDRRQSRIMRVLFRKAAVENRHTCIPYLTAYEWAGQEVPSESPSHGSEVIVEGNGDALYRGLTTGERMRVFAEKAAPLAKQAVRASFEEAGVSPSDVTHLVTVSCTGFDAPGIDIELIDGLKLPPTTERVNVGYMGCHGAINGLRVARGIASHDPSAVVLLSATELCSLHYRFNWDDEGIIGNALFADGSAALVLANRDETPQRPALQLKATGSCLIPDSRDVMSWRIGDHGFEMSLTADVSYKIDDHLRDWLSGWLDRQGHSIESIGSWAVHPGGPRILQAVESSLDLPEEATQFSRSVLSELGNMSSPTVLFIIDRMRKAGAPSPCLALGFGPGLMAEAALFE
ncbi:MAG: type III polyketide synthase [Planctomycetota bacterium]|nr:MAG: type III polyketide synthase [Planctomycetota bacterium]REK27859.1 MAG: type III polyketide synthase [Planctomycetota bacterium]REK32829.1 MAG: type III polyketide synthase [Planctomycetota bacterium]